MAALTHREYFEEEMRRGIHNGNPDHMRVFKNLTVVMADLDIRTAYEIGCGTGALIEAADERGIMVVGCDANPYHATYFWNRNPVLADRFMLTLAGEVFGMFDAIVSIEVLEHLTDDQIKWYMEQAKGKADWFIFSSTSEPDPEWDERWGHINLKSQEEWIALLDSYGWRFVKYIGVPTEWTMLLDRK